MENIPLPNGPAVTVGYAHLIRLLTEPQEECYADGAKRTYIVKDLLGTVYVDRERTEGEFMGILQRNRP